MSTSDLTKATRELFIRSLVDEVYMATPVVEELQRRRQVSYKGGTYIERLTDNGTTEDLVQEYVVGMPLVDQKSTSLQKPRFTWKMATMPLRYDVDEYLQNATAGDEEQLLDLVSHLTEKGHDGVRRYLCKKIFNSGSATGVADGATGFQSLVSALDHDVTYGTRTRSFSGGTNDSWQGADPAGLNESVTSSSQGTATNLTVANLRKWISESSIAHNMKTANDLYICMCPTLYNKLRAQMEARTVGYPAPANGTASQKLTKMVLDGHTITSVPYLQTTSTMKTWVFILNMRYWEMRIHTARNFNMTPFKWQAENSNGYDMWLSRIMWAGNLVCWKPNSSMWLSNVS